MEAATGRAARRERPDGSELSCSSTKRASARFDGSKSGAPPGATLNLKPGIQAESNKIPKPCVGGSSPPGGMALSLPQRFPCSARFQV